MLATCVAMLWMLLAAAAVSAQTTRPASVSAYDGQLIRKSASADVPTTRASTAMNAGRASTFLDLPRVLYALGIVLGLILILRWLARKLFPNAVGARASDIVRVLSRTPITPRQQVLLVQVGHRVLVVADNGTQMNALSEIKDVDEVASLVGKLNPRSVADTEAFRAALNESQKQYDEPDEHATAEESSVPSLAPAQTEIAGLVDKVRVLAKQLGR
jgi:flagellar biogenesis protein FliO